LRALEYFAECNAPLDERLEDAMTVLLSKRRSDGTWPCLRPHPGVMHFEQEPTGGPSRWNTMRASYVLTWWNAERWD
jgi:hypothetical protein